MDALIPFVDALAADYDASMDTLKAFGKAVERCREGGEGTVSLVAKLGRASYVGDNGNMPPDPGAMSLVALTRGMLEGLSL